MAIEHLIKEIKKLSPKQKEELFQRLGVVFNVRKEEKLRGGLDDPLSELIGIAKAPATSSQKYKEDLYGGQKPL